MTETKITFVRLLVFGSMLILASARPAMSDTRDGIGHEEAYRLVESGEIKTLAELLERHHDTLGGIVVEVELEREGGVVVYELLVLSPGGRYRELYIDAGSLEIIADEWR